MYQQKYMPKTGLKRPAYVLITTILILSITSSSIARISPLAFKGVTEHFKKGKEFYSPTLGMAALESGLIYNLRFYGNFKAGKDNNRRIYHNDSSDDPTWNLIKLLFPSNGGTLTVESQHPGNFGRYVNTPKAVAILLNYVYKVRKQNNLTYNATEDLNNILKILEEDQKQHDKPIKPVEKTIILLLDYIKKSIKEEEEGFYPKYTTEQIILAFFCEKFNTQTDIWYLLKGLDAEIVNNDETKSIPDKENLLGQEDLEKIGDETSYNIDDIYALANADIFTRVMPYKAGTNPISNGIAQAYNRSQEQLMEKQTFADCVEVAIRHIFNLMLYNAKEKKFDLTHINNYLGSKIGSIHNQLDKDKFQSASNNLNNFYKEQLPRLADSGDINLRTAWNKVVGDLNKVDNNPQDTIRYGTENGYGFEIRSGFINMLNVFIKAFRLTPTQLSGSNKPIPHHELKKILEITALPEIKSWIEAYFQAMFSALNPTMEYEIDLQNISVGKNKSNDSDVYGDLKVKVCEPSQELFSFTIEVRQGHSQVTNLQLLKQGNIDYEGQQVKAFEIFQSTLQPDAIIYKSLGLLLPIQQKSHQLYKLYPKMIEGDEVITESLCFIPEIPQDNYHNILINFLDKISWDNQNTVKKVSPYVKKLQAYFLQNNSIGKYVKGICIGSQDTLNLEDIKIINTQLEYLFILSSNDFTTIDVSQLNKLKKIILLTNYLKLANSKITSIANLSACKELETLDLSGTGKLQEINLKGLTNLKELILSNSGVSVIHHLSECIALETLDLAGTSGLSKIDLKGLVNLKKFDIDDCSAVDVLNLGNCRALEILDLTNSHIDTQKIGEEILLDSLLHLKELILVGTNIRTIKYLSQYNRLERLDLSKTDKLQQIELKGLANLKELSLVKSGIGAIKGLNECVELERLKLSATKNLKGVDLKGLVNLKELDLKKSLVKTITNLSECATLEQINLVDTDLDKNTRQAVSTFQVEHQDCEIEGF